MVLMITGGTELGSEMNMTLLTIKCTGKVATKKRVGVG